MNTRERIADEALSLFAQKGYDGVSVKDIANAVGIKDSSLYKHYKSKREIFDTILQQMSERMERMSARLQLPDAIKTDASSRYSAMSEQELTDVTKEVFLFYLKDEYVSRARRMLTIEQFHNSEVSTLYRKIFLEDSIAYQTEVFRQMVDSGAFYRDDPEIIAIDYYTPIFFLLVKYDQHPEQEEEALKILEKHVQRFVKKNVRVL